MIRNLINVSADVVSFNDMNGMTIAAGGVVDGLMLGEDRLKESADIAKALLAGTLHVSDGTTTYDGIRGIDLIRGYATQFTRDGKPITTVSDRPKDFYRHFTGKADDIVNSVIGNGVDLSISVPPESTYGEVDCRFVDNVYLKDGEACFENAPFSTKFYCNVMCPAGIPFPSPTQTGTLDMIEGAFVPNTNSTGAFMTALTTVPLFRFINGLSILNAGISKVESVEPFLINYPYFLRFSLEVPDVVRTETVRIDITLGTYRQKTI